MGQLTPITSRDRKRATSWNKSEQAFLGIIHPFSRKEAQFFENCFYSVKFHNTSKKDRCVYGILKFPEKMVCYALLQQNCYRTMVKAVFPCVARVVCCFDCL
jgi:hypothetical protein